MRKMKKKEDGYEVKFRETLKCLYGKNLPDPRQIDVLKYFYWKGYNEKNDSKTKDKTL